MSQPYACCLCGHALSNQRAAEGDHQGARVDRCSPYGASYEFWASQTERGGRRIEDPYDPDLALDEARHRGEAWASLQDLVRAHKRWRATGRKPGERRAGEASLGLFGGEAA